MLVCSIIYFYHSHQLDQIYRYEIYCVGYDDLGEPTTLEFVIEEGILDTRMFPKLGVGEPLKHPRRPLLPLNNGVYVLIQDKITRALPTLGGQLQKYESRLKVIWKKRIVQKLRALGYEVLATAK